MENEKSDCQDKRIKIVHNVELGLIVLLALILLVILIIIIRNFPDVESFLIVFFFLLLGVYPYYIHKKTIRLIQNVPEKDTDKPHHAIIIAHKRELKLGNFPFPDYLSGEDILIERFLSPSKEINFKVYDVNTKEQVIPIILNENATHLWIFGHGMRNKLALKGDFLCYFDVRNAPKKVFIGQYHCNSFLGRSLGDYNMPISQDISHFVRMDPFIRISVWRKLKELDTKGLL